MSKKRRPNQNPDVSDTQSLDEDLIVELEDGETSVNSLVYGNPEESQEETINDVTSEIVNTVDTSCVETVEPICETTEVKNDTHQHDINNFTSKVESSKTQESSIEGKNNETPNFRLGQKIMINPDAEKDYNGFKLPSFAYRNIYVIKKILNKRAIITSGTYTLAMKIDDICVANV